MEGHDILALGTIVVLGAFALLQHILLRKQYVVVLDLTERLVQCVKRAKPLNPKHYYVMVVRNSLGEYLGVYSALAPDEHDAKGIFWRDQRSYGTCTLTTHRLKQKGWIT